MKTKVILVIPAAGILLLALGLGNTCLEQRFVDFPDGRPLLAADYPFLSGFSRVRADQPGNAADAGVPVPVPEAPNSILAERLLLPGTAMETPLYIIESTEPGPVVMVVGGIHGDETAGYRAAERIISWEIDCGTLLVLPRANAPAVANRKRVSPGGSDLNRAFPGSLRGTGTRRLAGAIYNVIQEYRPHWVIDLHEAGQFERVSSGSLGQTIIQPEYAAGDLAEQVVETLNSAIREEKSKFLLLRGGLIRGTLVGSLSGTGIEGLMVETCRALPLAERIEYQLTVVYTVLRLLGIQVY